MSFQIFSGSTVSTGTKTILTMAIVAIAVVGLSAVGAAEVTDMANESVSFDNDSNVTVDVEWNDSIADAPNATADVTFYNASEYDSDPANATIVLEDSIAADEGNTTSTEYTEADGLVDGTDYRLVIEADDTEADSVSVSDSSGFVMPIFGDGSGGIGMLGIAVLLGGAWFVSRDD